MIAYCQEQIRTILKFAPPGLTPSQCQPDHTDRIAKLSIVFLEPAPGLHHSGADPGMV